MGPTRHRVCDLPVTYILKSLEWMEPFDGFIVQVLQPLNSHGATVTVLQEELQLE